MIKQPFLLSLVIRTSSFESETDQTMITRLFWLKLTDIHVDERGIQQGGALTSGEPIQLYCLRHSPLQTIGPLWCYSIYKTLLKT